MLVDVELKESEMLYRRLFETSRDVILILDFETGNIVDADPFIVKIIDFPLEIILGKKLWEIGLFSNKEQSELSLTELKTNGYIRFDDMPGNIREITKQKPAEKDRSLLLVLSILNMQNE